MLLWARTVEVSVLHWVNLDTGRGESTISTFDTLSFFINLQKFCPTRIYMLSVSPAAKPSPEARAMKRSILYRFKQGWGRFDDLKGFELRTYADGSIAEHLLGTDQAGRWRRRSCEWTRQFTDADWESVFAILRRHDAWTEPERDWPEPYMDGGHWTVSIRCDDQKLRARGAQPGPEWLQEVVEILAAR
jgi:hypothetical protein